MNNNEIPAAAALDIRRNLVRLICLFFAAVVTASVTSSSATGQGTGDAFRTDRQLEEKRRGARRAKPTPDLTQPQGQEARATAGSLETFILKRVVITGASVFSHDALANSYKRYIGRKVSAQDLLAIAEGMTKLYRSQGYFLSRAILPPQDVVKGSITVKILEGSIARVTFEGKPSRDFGLARLAGPIKAERPLRLATFERQLLLMNDTPGLRVKDTNLQEIGEGTGRFALAIHIEAWRYWGRLAFDNWGTDDIGPLQGFFSGAMNSPFATGDSISIDLSTIPDNSRELRYGRIALDQPFGPNGFRLGAAASTSVLRPSGARRLVDTRIKTENYMIKGTWVLRRSRKSSFWVTLSAGVRNASETNTSGPVYTDHVHAVSVLAQYRHSDAYHGINFLTVNLRQGFDVLGASKSGDPNLSRIGADSSFSKLFMAYSRRQAIKGNWSLYLSAAGQVASDALLASEEFYLGGTQYGRAFNAGEISGDNAIAASLELRYGQVLSGYLLKRYQIYGFVDAGVVSNKFSTGSTELYMSSFGAGTRFHFVHGLHANIEIAKPFADYSWAEHDDDARLSFSVSRSMKF